MQHMKMIESQGDESEWYLQTKNWTPLISEQTAMLMRRVKFKWTMGICNYVLRLGLKQTFFNPWRTLISSFIFDFKNNNW